MGELVLEDAAGEFLLVHGSDEFLSLARRPSDNGEVPIVRFAPEHSPLLAACLEAVLAEPAAGPLTVRAASDELRVEAQGGAVRVANLARRQPGSPAPEALELDLEVVAQMARALRGPRLDELGSPRPSVILTLGHGRSVAVETLDRQTVVSARTERSEARAGFAASLRRVVAAALAMVVANPGESAIRVAHVQRGPDQVLLERLAAAAGAHPYVVANARPGVPARPRRTARLGQEAATFVVQALARDDDFGPALEPAPADPEARKLAGPHPAPIMAPRSERP